MNLFDYDTTGIYPRWATLVQTITQPQGAKRKHFAAMQESARKDVERAFGVLQARFAIVKGPAQFWSASDLRDIMKTCIIIHNMIIEDERDLNLDFPLDSTPSPRVSSDNPVEFQEFVCRYRAVRSEEKHYQLRHDLIEHLWQEKGNKDM